MSAGRRRPQRGVILILTAAALTVLLGIGALAVDGAYLMEVRAELQNAADAVALAAASGLTVGQGEARLRAQQYADLNPVLGDPAAVSNDAVTFGRWDFAARELVPTTGTPNSVRVELQLSDTANSQALFLGPVLGRLTADVAVRSTASLGSRKMMMVLDRSESMGYDTVPPGPEQPLTDTKTAASRFLDLIQNFPIEGDRAGLVFYNDQAELRHELTDAFSSVQAAISQPNAAGLTNIAAGLCRARQELNANAGPGGLRIVILLSDGRTNTRINEDTCERVGTPGQDRNLPFSRNLSEQQSLRQAQRLAEERAILYTISLGLETNQALMNQMAAATGGEHFFAPTTAQLDEIFETISERIPVILVD